MTPLKKQGWQGWAGLARATAQCLHIFWGRLENYNLRRVRLALAATLILRRLRTLKNRVRGQQRLGLYNELRQLTGPQGLGFHR